MDVPITLGILLALALSVHEAIKGGDHAYFDAAVSLPFLLLIGRYLDHLLRRTARGAALDLAAMQTVTSTRIGADGVSIARQELVVDPAVGTQDDAPVALTAPIPPEADHLEITFSGRANTALDNTTVVFAYN
jgi:Cu2+-exporting ATPase